MNEANQVELIIIAFLLGRELMISKIVVVVSGNGEMRCLLAFPTSIVKCSTMNTKQEEEKTDF